MTTYFYRGVNPINPGYTGQIAVQFGETPWTNYNLATGRLAAHFRSNRYGPVVFESDTLAGSLFRTDTRTLNITIPAATTETFPESGVYFDFIRVSDAGIKTPIPGTWLWPVMRMVTGI